MSEVIEETSVEEVKTYTAEEYSALQESNASMKAKMDELLSETKAAKKSRQEYEEQAKTAIEEKAKKDGDFEQLYKSSTDKVSGLSAELEKLRSNIAQEKVKNQASAIASQLSTGANIELLSTFIAPRLRYSEDGITILDNKGQLTVSTVEDLTKEIQSNPTFASLLKGNQSSGGSATGGQSGSAANKILTRAEFDSLIPMKQMEFMKSGGKTID